MEPESPSSAKQQRVSRYGTGSRLLLLAAVLILLSVCSWWLGAAGVSVIPIGVTAEEQQRARQDFRRVQRRDPDDVELLLVLAENLARRGRLELAVSCAERIPVGDERCGLRSRLLLAQYCLRLKRAAGAERAVRELLSVAGSVGGGSGATEVQSARELLVFLLSLQFRFEEREVELRELRKGGLLEPLLTKQLYFPSLLAWKTPQQNERLQQFLRESPEDSRLVAAHVRYLLGAGSGPEARRLIDAAVALSPGDAGVLAAALECRFEAQDVAGFRALLAACSQYVAGEPWLMTQMRGEAAALSGDWSESARCFEILVAADATNPLYCQGLARAYGQLGRGAERLRLQQRALQLAELRLTLGEAELKNPGALRAAGVAARELGLRAAADDLEQLAQRGEQAMRNGQERRP